MEFCTFKSAPAIAAKPLGVSFKVEPKQTRMSFEILYSIPISGSYPEKHFGDSFKRSLWVKFVTKDYTEWIGCFGKGQNNFDKVLVNATETYALVISGGQGYFIDVDTRDQKLIIADYPQIDSAIHYKKSDEFLFSTFLTICIIDTKFNLLEIEPNFGVDGIYLLEEQDEKVIGQLYSYTFSIDYNVGFEIDMSTRELKKDITRLYDYNTMERIYEKTKQNRDGIFDKIKKLFT